jgi:hypothetical protein
MNFLLVQSAQSRCCYGRRTENHRQRREEFARKGLCKDDIYQDDECRRVNRFHRAGIEIFIQLYSRKLASPSYRRGAAVCFGSRSANFLRGQLPWNGTANQTLCFSNPDCTALQARARQRPASGSPITQRESESCSTLIPTDSVDGVSQSSIRSVRQD